MLLDEQLRVILMESLSFTASDHADDVRRAAVKCIAELRRGLSESRVLIALPELPEALFLCIDAGRSSPDHKAIYALTLLCEKDAPRRCAYWLRLCRHVVCGDPWKLSETLLQYRQGEDRWDTGGTSTTNTAR